METRGERLKRLRIKAELSQEQLAKKVGVTKANVSKWESRASPNIDLNVFFELAKLFEIDPRELATGKASSPTDTSDIPPRRLALIRAYGRLPDELRLPIRALIESIDTAGNSRYTRWSREEGERAKKRDSKKPQSA